MYICQFGSEEHCSRLPTFWWSPGPITNMGFAAWVGCQKTNRNIVVSTPAWIWDVLHSLMHSAHLCWKTSVLAQRMLSTGYGGITAYVSEGVFPQYTLLFSVCIGIPHPFFLGSQWYSRCPTGYPLSPCYSALQPNLWWSSFALNLCCCISIMASSVEVMMIISRKTYT